VRREAGDDFEQGRIEDDQMSTTTNHIVAATAACLMLSTVATDAPAQTSMSFSDDFYSYPRNVCMPDGALFGPWKVEFAGFGCVKVIADTSMTSWLSKAPNASKGRSETHAALTLGPHFAAPYTYSVRLNTIEQLRPGSTSNPWEVGWILWNYTDNTHFYYIALKPNGWELGKEDPAYPGAQRFLADGSSPKFPIGQQYDVSISHGSDGTISVSVDGAPLVTFQDQEGPYSNGQIGLYTEDASVNFTSVSVSIPLIAAQ
jgi:hypothetical protein